MICKFRTFRCACLITVFLLGFSCCRKHGIELYKLTMMYGVNITDSSISYLMNMSYYDTQKYLKKYQFCIPDYVDILTNIQPIEQFIPEVVIDTYSVPINILTANNKCVSLNVYYGKNKLKPTMVVLMHRGNEAVVAYKNIALLQKVIDDSDLMHLTDSMDIYDSRCAFVNMDVACRIRCNYLRPHFSVDPTSDSILMKYFDCDTVIHDYSYVKGQREYLAGIFFYPNK